MAPQLMFPQFMDDENPEERSFVIFMDIVLMGKCSEVWVLGDRISTDMGIEIARAKQIFQQRVYGGGILTRDLAIAYGNNSQAKKWVNKTIKFEDLKERLKTTMRMTEFAEEYAKVSKAQRDAAKDHSGFDSGALKGGRRKVETVEKCSMITLDGDRIEKEFLENYEKRMPYTSALYTTHSSTEEVPRVRILVPMTRDVTPEEFGAISRYLATSESTILTSVLICPISCRSHRERAR